MPRADWLAVQYNADYEGLNTRNLNIERALFAHTYAEHGVTEVGTTEHKRRVHEIAAKLTDIEWHPDSLSDVQAMLPSPSRRRDEVKWDRKARHAAACCRIRESQIRFVFLCYEYVSAPRKEYTNLLSYILIARRDWEAFSRFVAATSTRESSSPLILTHNGGGTTTSRLSTSVRLKDLVLDQKITDLVYRDVAGFMKRKAWFKRNHLPWKRGYMFYGPPGNGKTSLVKTLIKKFNLNAHIPNFAAPDFMDTNLQALVTDLGTHTKPAFLLMEDLDRFFPAGQPPQTKTSLSGLLNTLDGVGSVDGIITIATANNPTDLDRAILKRPGRFDRVVCFGNPDTELRRRYFRQKARHLDEGVIAEIADRTEAFSFAQLQETFILAGGSAYERGAKQVKDEDLRRAADTLREFTNLVGKKALKVGLGV